MEHLLASTQIDLEVGFRYRKIMISDEGSTLHDHEDYYEIFLTLSDKIMHQINGETQYLPKGSLLFIRKKDMHFYPNELPLSFINLAFTEEMTMQLFEFLSDGFCSKELLDAPMPPQIQLNDSDIDWLCHELDKLNSTFRDNIPELQYKCRILLFKIFTRYFANFHNLNSKNSDNYIPQWLHKLNYEMQKIENFSQDTHNMVKLSGKSREHLCRSIKKYYDKTLSEYINDLRLNYIANSLLNSNTPVIELCYACGFENISWAYTLFKTRYGTSPIKFRKNQ